MARKPKKKLGTRYFYRALYDSKKRWHATPPPMAGVLNDGGAPFEAIRPLRPFHDPGSNITAALGMQSSAPLPPQERVQAFIEEVKALNGRLTQVLNRSALIADKLFGAMPAQGEEGKAGVPSGALAELGDGFIAAHALVGFIDRQITRLEDL